MDAEISFNRFSEENATRRMIATTPALAEVIAKRAMGEELALQESVMLDSYVASILIGQEYAWLQHQRGRIEDYDIETLVRRIQEDFWGIESTWDRMRREGLDDDFVAAVERELGR